MSEQPPLVLVVEDEPDLADLYAAWLGDEYRVRTAYGGHEALDQLDEVDDEVDAARFHRDTTSNLGVMVRCSFMICRLDSRRE